MKPASSKIKVLVVDDQRLVRDGIASLLGLDDEITVIGTAGNGKEALALAREFRPDVCMLDIQMPVMDGITTLERMRAEGLVPYVVMLTTFDDREYIIRSLRSGAVGYLLKDLPSEEFVRAIKQVVKGVFLANGEVMNKLLGSLKAEEDSEKNLVMDSNALEQYNFLTLREQKVLSLLGTGATNTEIADILSLSEDTVKNYVSSILTTLGFRDRIQTALFAARNRLTKEE